MSLSIISGVCQWLLIGADLAGGKNWTFVCLTNCSFVLSSFLGKRSRADLRINKGVLESLSCVVEWNL